jgi:hypothetical protein
MLGNPHGFFETNKPSGTKTFKCIHANILRRYPEAKVVFIDRPAEQIQASWEKAGRKKDFLHHIKNSKNLFYGEIAKRPNLIVTYENMHKNTRAECERIREFLKDDLAFDVDKAVTAVDHTLYKEQ